MCYYENIIDEKRDLAPLLKSKKEFEVVINNYPLTDFATDARFKIELINDRLAGKEMYIGRHYLNNKKWIAAINRFKNVLENYGTTVYVEEAIHRLVEVHYIIGLESEAEKYASLLGYNYKSSDWYKATYKIFNKEYDFSIKKFQETKTKDKRSIFKRFVGKFKKILLNILLASNLQKISKKFLIKFRCYLLQMLLVRMILKTLRKKYLIFLEE